MSSQTLQENALELAWSLWSELGVPGLDRNHGHTVVDPEPLIVASPSLVGGDPRLQEQILGWCVTHSDRISASRLKGILRAVPVPVGARFGALSRAVGRRRVRWPTADGGEAWRVPTRLPTPPLPVERPSLFRFRLRALCGVGARADVLCELIARGASWTSAGELAQEGYTKRNVARILSELESAGVVRGRRDGPAVRYQLAQPELLGELVGGRSPALPDWRAILGLVLNLLELAEHESAAGAVRRVEASAIRERAALACRLLSLEAPPVTRGVPDAWDAVLEWGTGVVRDLASGRSPAFAPSAGPR